MGKAKCKLTHDELMEIIKDEIKQFRNGQLNKDYKEKMISAVNRELKEAKVEVGMKTFTIPDEVYNEIARRVKLNFLSLIQQYEDAKKGK
tara:strand:+ start:213 stop:482 length:270 start_codon:yes stop_codon:yes gene_type:complete